VVQPSPDFVKGFVYIIYSPRHSGCKYEAIPNLIGKVNGESAKDDYKHGAVHSSQHTISEGIAFLELDLGSSGLVFMKTFLKKLSALNAFKKVRLV